MPSRLRPEVIVDVGAVGHPAVTFNCGEDHTFRVTLTNPTDTMWTYWAELTGFWAEFPHSWSVNVAGGSSNTHNVPMHMPDGYEGTLAIQIQVRLDSVGGEVLIPTQVIESVTVLCAEEPAVNVTISWD